VSKRRKEPGESESHSMQLQTGVLYRCGEHW